MQYRGNASSMVCTAHSNYAAEKQKSKLKDLNENFMVVDFGGETIDSSRLRCIYLQCTKKQDIIDAGLTCKEKENDLKFKL